MKKNAFFIILSIVLFCLIFTSCNIKDKPQIYYNYEYFGTALTAVLYADNKDYSIWKNDAENILRNLSAILNADDEESDIARFNNSVDGEIVEINELTYNLILKTKEVYQATNGAYNPCVYYLVDLWGFSPRFSRSKENNAPYDRDWNEEEGYYPLPAEEYKDAFLQLSDYDKIRVYIQDGKYFIVKNQTAVFVGGITYYTKLDMGGLIKGYATDLLKESAEKLGITRGYVSFGTSSVTLLNNSKGKNFDLALTNPRKIENSENKEYLKFKIKNSNISSSGDYERYYIYQNKRYSHIIDGKTGSPAENGICAATVISADACLSDMISTAVCAMGRQEATDFMKSDFCREKDIGIIMCFDNGETLDIFINKKLESAEICDKRFRFNTV